MSISDVVNKVVSLYKNNKVVSVNANAVASGLPALLVASSASYCMDNLGCDAETIAIGAAAVDYVAYLGLQGALYYQGNHQSYSGSVGRKKLRKELMHLYTSELPANVLYYSMQGPLHYVLMNHDLNAAVANQLAWVASIAVERVVHTFIGWKTGLFKQKDN
ncbi:hypothetical protein HN419_07330 [Candidatus Woesearchaeota archaeon]|jgi:hypothetical protein|nr:hypothetical protein [Candidatus Woesearchaeota archaeon]MBT3538305.1 hypothetical protein [Candidatus Woesearchaeota archaeon]MBT4696701.1 hypothetical protein [Candidatus Woesearchaeota archaeon]MBT4716819.1 hypothetical protein [Candidatus Woesearchaeota archaeon]MBT7105974.1 hypothetical protein [Candidatus Woesearchaeota archaeon]